MADGVVVNHYNDRQGIHMKKTIILLNLRFSEFYSTELFKRIKEKYEVRLVAILDQHFKERINNHILPYLDKTYLLESQSKDGFLAEFDFDSLSEIVEKETRYGNDIKIVCTDEFNLLQAGRLRRKFNLTGHTDLDMMVFRDKTKMKAVLQKAGIRVPRYKMLQSEDNFQSLSDALGLPFVIKPTDSCGSFGVYIIQTESDYFLMLDKIKNSTAHFEAEEYIDGKLFHVDSCTQNNKITFICANEYSCPNNHYTKGHPLGSIPITQVELENSLIQFARQVLAKLKSNNLVNHMEIFVTEKNELVFLEISARPPGGLVNWVHQINFSINLMDLDFFMQTELFVELPKQKKGENAFWMNFPLLPGKIKQFLEPVVKSRYDITYFREVGATICSDECNSIVGKMAHGIFYHSDKYKLRQDFEYIKLFHLAEMNNPI